ncbi:hypothetical protein ABVT39_016710 [Epinephelus coioides]
MVFPHITEPEPSAISLHHMLHAACLSNVHINHSATIRQPRTRSHRLTGPQTGERGCTETEPPCLVPVHRWTRAGAARPPGELLRLSVRLTGQMLLLEAGHSWLDPSCYASILLLQAAVTATTFPHAPTRQINKTNSKQSRARFNAPIYSWRPRGTQPATHPPTRPATIADQRRDVTMRRWIIFRYRNRSTR